MAFVLCLLMVVRCGKIRQGTDLLWHWSMQDPAKDQEGGAVFIWQCLSMTSEFWFLIDTQCPSRLSRRWTEIRFSFRRSKCLHRVSSSVIIGRGGWAGQDRPFQLSIEWVA
jgi:hypothetical protein